MAKSEKGIRRKVTLPKPLPSVLTARQKKSATFEETQPARDALYAYFDVEPTDPEATADLCLKMAAIIFPAFQKESRGRKLKDEQKYSLDDRRKLARKFRAFEAAEKAELRNAGALDIQRATVLKAFKRANPVDEIDLRPLSMATIDRLLQEGSRAEKFHKVFFRRKEYALPHQLIGLYNKLRNFPFSPWDHDLLENILGQDLSTPEGQATFAQAAFFVASRERVLLDALGIEGTGMFKTTPRSDKK